MFKIIKEMQIKATIINTASNPVAWLKFKKTVPSVSKDTEQPDTHCWNVIITHYTT